MQRVQRSHLQVDFGQLLNPEQAALVLSVLGQLDWPSGNRRSNKTFGDPGLTYISEYGGWGDRPLVRKIRPAEPWGALPGLDVLRDMVTAATGQVYTVCIIQRYPHGRVGISPHRDKEMRPGTTIAGLSLGATRYLTLAPTGWVRGQEKFSLALPSGSLYALRPPTNDFWLHSIEKDDSTEPRFSLTFRNY